MPEYLVVHGRHARVFEAGSVNDAVVQASKVMGSVYDLVVGATFMVFPVEFAQERRMQYERPMATEPERLPAYGEARLVDEFARSHYSDKPGMFGRPHGES